MSECISCGARLPGLDNVCKEMCWVIVMARLRVELEAAHKERDEAMEDVAGLLQTTAYQDLKLRAEKAEGEVERLRRHAESLPRCDRYSLAHKHWGGVTFCRKGGARVAQDISDALVKADADLARLREGLRRCALYSRDHTDDTLDGACCDCPKCIAESLLADTKEPKCNP